MNTEEVIGWGWENGDAVAQDLDGALVVYGVYECEAYEGSVIVIYIRAGRMFVVESSHCSCNGPEWSPKETTPEKLMAEGGFIAGDADAIEQALAIYVDDNGRVE